MEVKQLLKHTDYLVVSISTIAVSGVSFLFSIIARRYVIPYEYGIYSTCMLLHAYLAYIQCGVLNAYNRDLPQMIGAQKNEEAVRLQVTVLNFFVMVYTVSGILISGVLYVLFQFHIFDKRYFWGYLAAIFFLVVDNIASFGMNTMRAYGKFYYSSAVQIVKAVGSFVIGVAALKMFGYYGLYFMPISASICSIMLYGKVYVGKWSFKIDITFLKYLVKTGFPLMFSSFIWTLMASVDKFIILFFMTTEELGVYSVPLMGFSTMVLIPQSVSQVFYIKLSGAYGKTKEKRVLIDLGNRYTEINSIFTSMAAVAAFYLLPLFVKKVMPDYAQGITAAQILLVGVAIYGTTMLYGNIFSVLQWNRDLIVNSTLLCVFNVCASGGLVLFFGKHINYVALGTSISYALYSFLLLFKLAKKFQIRVFGYMKSSWRVILCELMPSVVIYLIAPFNIAAVSTACITFANLYLFIRRKNGTGIGKNLF